MTRGSLRVVDKFGRYDGNNLILDMRGVSHLAVLVECLCFLGFCVYKDLYYNSINIVSKYICLHYIVVVSVKALI